MATATQILDRASMVTGLFSTGNERTMGFQALQNSYIRAVMDAQVMISTATASLTASTSEYTISSAFGVTPLRITDMTLISGTDIRQLKAMPESWITENDINSQYSAYPEYFATLGSSKIILFPRPTSGLSLKMYYVPNPPTLIESSATPGAGEEVTPSYIPVQFHWDVLYAGLVTELFDKDQRSKDVQFWQQRYMDGLARLRQWSASFAGEADGTWIPRGNGNILFPDQRSRY